MAETANERHEAEPKPRLVYHYTTLEALRAIIETGRLRATHFEYLNDPEELHYCRALFGEHERQRSPEFGDPPLFGEGYIVSFSELADDLALWRMYGDKGAGVAIGFLLDSEFALPPYWEVRWLRVEYSIAKQRAAIATAEPGHYLALAPAWKRDVHAFEKEWRLVAWTGAFLDLMPPVSFRASKFGLTPSVDITPVAAQLPIREIVLGPAVGPKAVYSVGLLVKSKGYFPSVDAPDESDTVFIRHSSVRAQ